MSLDKTIVGSDNKLRSLEEGSRAISEKTILPAESNNLESIRDISSTILIENILDINRSSVDKAVVNNGIIETGDSIVIVKDNVVYETTASDVIKEPGDGILPAEIADTGNIDGFVHTDFRSNTINGTHMFSNVNTGYFKELYMFKYKTTKYDLITFTFNEEIEIQGISGNFDIGDKYQNCIFYLQYSLDGETWLTIAESSKACTSRGIWENMNLFSLKSLKSKYFRLSVSSYNSYRYGDMYIKVYLKNIQLYNNKEKLASSFSTSVITDGTVPTNVYLLKNILNINATDLTQSGVNYTYGITGTKLKMVQTYNDILVTGKELQTRVKFSAKNNELIELTGKIYTQPVEIK